MSRTTSRRDLLKLTTTSAALALAGCREAVPAVEAASPRAPTVHPRTLDIPRRRFGNTDAAVSAIGVGGFHLAETPDEAEAIRIVHEAIDAGINFFDNAWEYHDGKSEEVLGRALVGKRDAVFLMTKVCTHGRDRRVAVQQLEDSLRRLKTDHLDLWQVHECIYDNDPELHFAAGGVIEALEQAKREGKVRYVGFTGHKDPKIHLAMLGHNFPFDSVQMPLNCFDASFRSFEQKVVPLVAQRGMAILGMKSMGGAGQAIQAGVVTPEEALRYAMSVRGVTVTISGIDSIDILRQNLAVARGFEPMSDAEMDTLRTRVAVPAADGHFELYKTTKQFDAKVGRLEHGYPSVDDLPL
jgi:aryl-alcohol dehydrogenase-like predicted oxidoreductase